MRSYYQTFLLTNSQQVALYAWPLREHIRTCLCQYRVQRMRRVRAAFYRKVGFITKSFVLMQVLYFSIHIRIHYFQGQQLPSHDANTKPNAFFLLHKHTHLISTAPVSPNIIIFQLVLYSKFYTFRCNYIVTNIS